MNIVTEGKSAVNTGQWKEKVKAYHLPRAEINKVIMEYLVKEGFKDVNNGQKIVLSVTVSCLFNFPLPTGCDGIPGRVWR